MNAYLNSYKNMYDILIATPNKNAYPETIKLGWRPLNNQYYYKLGFLLPSPLQKGEIISLISNFSNSSDTLPSGELFQAGNSFKFINWRYQDPNYIKIKFETVDKQVLYVVYRKENVKGMTSIILCDSYGNQKLLKLALKRILAREKTTFVYYLENPINEKILPLVSVKHRNALFVFKGNINLDSLLVSLGDLEGKL